MLVGEGEREMLFLERTTSQFSVALQHLQVFLKRKVGNFHGKPRPPCYLTPWFVFQIFFFFLFCAAPKDAKLDVTNVLVSRSCACRSFF